MQVWKYKIPIKDATEIEMPKGARIVHVDIQYGEPCLWALVNPQADKETRYIRVAGTGHEVSPEDTMDHLGTFMLAGGTFVGHVFEMDPVAMGRKGG